MWEGALSWVGARRGSRSPGQLELGVALGDGQVGNDRMGHSTDRDCIVYLVGIYSETVDM